MLRREKREVGNELLWWKVRKERLTKIPSLYRPQSIVRLGLSFKKLNMDPTVLRLKNMLRDGDCMITGQVMQESRGLGLGECIEKVKERIQWDQPIDRGEGVVNAAEVSERLSTAQAFRCYLKAPVVSPIFSWTAPSTLRWRPQRWGRVLPRLSLRLRRKHLA